MNRTSHTAFNPMSPTSVLHKGHSVPSAGRGSRLYVAESSSIMSPRGALGCRSHSSDLWCLIRCDVSSCRWGGSSGQRWYCTILHTWCDDEIVAFLWLLWAPFKILNVLALATISGSPRWPGNDYSTVLVDHFSLTCLLHLLPSSFSLQINPLAFLSH